MKIGIYGGTFNPIHSGHVHILREFIRRLGLEKALLIPTGQPPHKEAPELAAKEHRLAMCRLAAEEIAEAAVEVSTIECDRPGKSYSAETLTLLKEQYPEDELYFLMGEDMFLTLHQWYEPEVICACAALCASPRSEDGYDRLLAQQVVLEKEYNARCFVEDIPYVPISSTQVRALAAAGESLSGLVPGPVERYLAEHRVYPVTGWAMSYEEYEAEVRRHLTDKRFYHSRRVAEEAVLLAERYGADPEKARIAGILHDIMKDTPKEEQLKIIEESGIILASAERANPKLWHSMAGALYAEEHLGVTDREVLDAIRYHTGGRAGMTLMDKVLFVADYNSADRDYPEVEVMRALAEKSLEAAIVYGVAWTVNDLMEQRLPVAADSVHTYNEALEILGKKESET